MRTLKEFSSFSNLSFLVSKMEWGSLQGNYGDLCMCVHAGVYVCACVCRCTSRVSQQLPGVMGKLISARMKGAMG